MTADDLRAFEAGVAAAFERGGIRAPVHLCSEGQIEPLIEIFKNIRREDWVFSTWRWHYHALLHGVPRETLMDHLLSGGGMNFHSPEYRFFTSAIVGGCLPIAVGVAAAILRTSMYVPGKYPSVWVFVGDMTASIGTFHDATKYANGHHLPIHFVIEDNGLSTNTPTWETWGVMSLPMTGICYSYERSVPHYGAKKAAGF